MQKQNVCFLATLFFLSLTAFSQEQRRYPWIAPPGISIERTGDNTARVVIPLHTNIFVRLLRATTLDGPWNDDSSDLTLTSGNNFVKAVVDVYNLREGQYGSASTVLFAVRVAYPENMPELTTSNGFHLKIEVTNWVEGISIFRVEDGPSSGDL